MAELWPGGVSYAIRLHFPPASLPDFSLLPGDRRPEKPEVSSSTLEQPRQCSRNLMCMRSRPGENLSPSLPLSGETSVHRD